MTYQQIQEDAIKRYRVTIDEESKCRRRMHAHVKERRICKWHPKNSALATFELLHEIGHVETKTGLMRRCESEYAATQWALERCNEYGVIVPDNIIKRYQDYIWRELDRGIRRRGNFVPDMKERLTLKKPW